MGASTIVFFAAVSAALPAGAGSGSPPPSPDCAGIFAEASGDRISLEEAFLRAIAAEPGDWTAKLVYSDWLEEQGDRRAEIIRIDHRIAQSGGTAPGWQAERRRGLVESWMVSQYGEGAGQLTPRWNAGGIPVGAELTSPKAAARYLLQGGAHPDFAPAAEALVGENLLRHLSWELNNLDRGRSLAGLKNVVASPDILYFESRFFTAPAAEGVSPRTALAYRFAAVERRAGMEVGGSEGSALGEGLGAARTPFVRDAMLEAMIRISLGEGRARTRCRAALEEQYADLRPEIDRVLGELTDLDREGRVALRSRLRRASR